MHHGLKLPNILSRDLFSQENRLPNSIYLIDSSVSSGPLNDFFCLNEENVEVIKNNAQLRRKCAHLALEVGNSLLERFKTSALSVLGAVDIQVALAPEGSLTAAVTLASNQNKACFNGDRFDKIVHILEDDISPRILGRFFQYYTDLPKVHQPLFIIEAAGDVDRLSERLNQCPDTFSFIRVKPHGALERFRLPNIGCKTFDTFVENYTNAVFSTVASTAGPDLEKYKFKGHSLLRELSTRLFRIRALVLEKGKFATVEDAREFEEHLISEEERRLKSEDATILLLFKALNNLFMLYARERTRGLLDNSMAIACALGDRLLQAHCLRYINLIEKPGPFAEFCLRGAAQIFQEKECFDHANYCLNNLLLGRFYSEKPVANDFEDLISRSADLIPNFRGVGIMYNNAGVANLIEGRYARALEIFNEGLGKPNMSIHKVGLDVNRLMAQWVGGGRPSRDEIISVADLAYRQVDHRYNYQLASVFLNLLRMAEGDSGTCEYLRKRMGEADLLSSKKILADTGSLGHLLEKTGLRTRGRSEIHPGSRGSFVKRHSLAPIIHYAWL